MFENRIETHIIERSLLDWSVNHLNQRGYLVVSGENFTKNYYLITTYFQGNVTLPSNSQQKVIDNLREKNIQNI